MRRIAWIAMALAACSREGGAAGPWLTMPDAAEHAERYFPYTAGSSHASATCDDCHGAFDTFARFDCLHCHDGTHADEAAVASRHAGVASFQYASEACYMCHRDGVGVDHTPFFPIDSGAHAATLCGDCHVDPSDRKVLGCAGCHPHTQADTDAAHAQVGGYGFQSALCVRCHAESQVTRIAAHLPFRIGPGAPHQRSTPGEGGSCLRCHPQLRADKTWAQDFASLDCLACHPSNSLAGEHSGRPGYSYSTPSCLASSCHASGLKEGD